VYGLGYHLLVFVYEKSDDQKQKTARLDIQHTIFLKKECTADFQLTKGIREILRNDGNVVDIISFILKKA